MADNRRYGLTPQLDIGQILQEAQNRWLRPIEVCEILRNYKKFCLSSDPPHKPTDGSLFLFDRKALRYFRKDGLNWRKKKDGKTVREAHERLKAGSIDVLHCYYAHGEDNENFQRRSYWMLEEQYEHIVLVHYREIKEGNKAGHMRSINTERSLQMVNSGGHITSLSSSTQAPTNSLLAQKAYSSSPSISEWNGPTHSSEFEEGESGDDVGAALSVEAESSSAEEGSSRQHLTRKEDLVVDSRVYHPQSYLKGPTNMLAENKVSYSLFNVNEVGSGQYPFHGLEQSEQGNFSEHIDESQLNITFQGTCSHDYIKGENLNLIRNQGNYSGKQIFSPVATSDLSGCSYSGMQTKNVDAGGNEINNGLGINLSSWTEVLELCKTGIQNATDEAKVPCLQSMTSEDIVGRHTNTPMETFVNSELNCGQQAYADTCVSAFAKDVSMNVEQMGSHKKFTSNSMLSVDQQQMAGPGYGSLDACEQKKSILRDSEEVKESAYRRNHQERKHQTHDNDNSQPSQNEYSVKLESENGPFEYPFYPHLQKQLLQQCSSEAGGQEGFKKMDSFGRWMSREIGGDGEDSLVASDSSKYWNSLENQNGVEEVSSLSRQMQFDNDLMSPSLSQDQLFSILDFSPDWAYPELETKVLITGTYMGDIKDTHKYKFSCMFGEIEVSAEVLGPGVLRCQAPHHTPGRVPFYVTCSNRLACSEVREFEYRVGLSQEMVAGSNTDNEAIDEMLLQIRFAKSLYMNFDKAQIYVLHDEDGSCNLRDMMCSLTKDGDEEWREMEKSIKHSPFDKTREQLMQKLLKEKLYTWLLWKINDKGKGPNILDNKGQGALHLAAALGYDWAMGLIVSAGVNVNFRDVHGWTALHWAAFYGREQTVSTLISLGAAPGALTDPTPKFAAGRTPADLASSHGHKGIAGYLAETSLTNHLSSLTINENIMGSVSATLAGDKAVETVAERNVVQLDGGREDQLSLKDSLAAVRNAAQAAARIQTAFRMHSFRRRQAIEYGDGKGGMPEKQALSCVYVQKKSRLGNHDEPLNAAAIRIQRKFRGWKGRRDFLIIRQKIVKIQAHFRGHQVRKNYKKIIWSVGIVEKAILRWRRKGVGLRGFRADKVIEVSQAQDDDHIENDDDNFLRAARKQTEAGIEKALARVQSMIQYPEARHQYRRMLAFKQTKVDIEGISDGKFQMLNDCETNEEDVLMSTPE